MRNVLVIALTLHALAGVSPAAAHAQWAAPESFPPFLAGALPGTLMVGSSLTSFDSSLWEQRDGRKSIGPYAAVGTVLGAAAGYGFYTYQTRDFSAGEDFAYPVSMIICVVGGAAAGALLGLLVGATATR